MGKDSYIKNLGQVAAVVFSRTPPTKTFILWYDLISDTLKIYKKSLGIWVSLSSELTAAENLVTEGKGLVFKEKVDTVLKFRRLKGEGGVDVRTEGNNVVIKLKDYLEPAPSSITFDSVIGAEYFLRVNSNVFWTLIVPASLTNVSTGWLSFDKTNGYGMDIITITITHANPSTASRGESIILRDPTGILPDREINLTQLGSSGFAGKYQQNTNDLECEFIDGN